VGYSLGSEKPGASAIAALLHAIHPKPYPAEYGLAREWRICGSPQFLVVDRSFSNDSAFATALHRLPETRKITLLHFSSNSPASVMGSIERLMTHVTTRILKFHPTSSVGNRSSNGEQSTCLTQKDIERLLVKYFVDEHNQSVHPHNGFKTRSQKWEIGRSSSSESSLK
jgi:putative transposase